MKIAITVSRGGIARNILKNDFYGLLRERVEQIVLITQASNDKRFIDEFGGEKVRMVELKEDHTDKLSNFFERIGIYVILNLHTKRGVLYNYIEIPKNIILQRIKYFFIFLCMWPISKVNFFKKIIRFVDFYFVQLDKVEYYKKILIDNEINLFFSTNMADETEVAILKAARKLGIKTIAMPKTWDNPTKRIFRVNVDHIVVWSNYMKQQMVDIQGYKESSITIIGIPQFDCYKNESKFISREKFCELNGLDPKKKIILFGSEGKNVPSDRFIADKIAKAIQTGEINYEAQLYIRPHFAYRNDEDKFKDLDDYENVVLDETNNPSRCFRDRWDYSDKQIEHFLNLLRHTDVLVTTCSTLVIDAAAVSTPSILIFFDEKGGMEVPMFKSVRRWYECDYYRDVRKVKSAPEVYSSVEMINKINQLLKNPALFEKERNNLIDFFAFKVDGLVGKRLYDDVVEVFEGKDYKF